jgi:hypothetical protein
MVFEKFKFKTVIQLKLVKIWFDIWLAAAAELLPPKYTP